MMVSLLLICLQAALALAASTSPANTSTALNNCLASKKVPYIRPSSPQWTQEVRPYNLRLAYTPAAIALPTTVDHVQDAVKCGNQYQVRVSAKSGGHSYGSFGYGGENGHLVIVLDSMDQVTLNKYMSCNIQAGARLGHVASELYKLGQRAIPHGSCPGVGIAGHALHGGYGFASRTYGLTLDTFIGATVILANGSRTYAADGEGGDNQLMWALRGAGSSYGIVVELDFQTIKAPDTVTPFNIELDWNENQAVEGLIAFQKFAVTAPKQLNMQIYIGPSGQTIQGVYYGTRATLNTALKPFLGDIKAQISASSIGDWIEGLKAYANGQNLDQRRPYNQHSTFYSTSLMTKALTRSQVKSFVRTLFDNIKDSDARHSWYILIDLFGGPNSAITTAGSTNSAFPHRDKLLLFQFSDHGNYASHANNGFTLLKRFRESITKTMDDSDWGMYANYLDTQLENREAVEQYYELSLGRLRELKRAYDRNDMFWNPQGIRPATRG
ncbi:hypothetical protein FOVG_11530 [Fusarium oxysporum f. sp. pisi HDV247]|uniref:FAD-binding PCMH-type domain-containing protein n=1 Tax=Fusarium oxysporum f. sp. pisi HDV247 TaxID=1080344 RepID=W9PBH7_FUSOX|nr:hypothetical protein FOVG_11530 [Fusarium oxysporum f. sp. pisi HDV247]